jgi:hypothetical protein
VSREIPTSPKTGEKWGTRLTNSLTRQACSLRMTPIKLCVGGNPHFWQKQPEMGHPASEGFISMKARGNKKRGPYRPRLFFTLYFYFSNFAGVNRKGSGKYISRWINRMPGIGAFWGLDKIRSRGGKTPVCGGFAFYRRSVPRTAWRGPQDDIPEILLNPHRKNDTWYILPFRVIVMGISDACCSFRVFRASNASRTLPASAALPLPRQRS